jgi:DNA replication protein DnaC
MFADQFIILKEKNMIIHPVLENLRKLRLTGAAQALELQLNNTASQGLTFEERLSLLVDYEMGFREQKRLQSRLKRARFKNQACIPDIIYDPSRKLDRSLILALENCLWVREHKNILITGATGTGKSYIAEALAHSACLKEVHVLRVQFPRILHDLTAAKADGGYARLQAHLAKVEVLLIDDFGLAPFTDENRRDFLEIADERYNRKATIITSQLPVQNWHQAIGDSTLGDAILDRLVHNAYRISLEGESMRRKQKGGIHEKA